MKRILFLILISAIFLSLCACRTQESVPDHPVTFYYLRADISADTTYGDADSVVVPEVQESLEYGSSLNYLLALYMNGPSDSRLYSPFPSDLQIVSIQRSEDSLIVTFNDSLAKLRGIKLTKACACIALTCLGLTNAETISICTSTQMLENQKSIDLCRDDLILEDLTPNTEKGGNS